MKNSQTNTIGVILALFLTLNLDGTVHAGESGFSLVVTCAEKGASEATATKVEIYVPDRLCCDGYDGLVKGLKKKQSICRFHASLLDFWSLSIREGCHQHLFPATED